MSKVAVVYWSGSGNTEEMAKAVVKGAQDKGADAELIYCNDFSASKVVDYDAIAFGCPAMGAEVLEESEFQPMFDEVSAALGGKKIALFGSYGWGTGASLACDSVICNNTPDDEGLMQCEALGAALA